MHIDLIVWSQLGLKFVFRSCTKKKCFTLVSATSQFRLFQVSNHKMI